MIHPLQTPHGVCECHFEIQLWKYLHLKCKNQDSKNHLRQAFLCRNARLFFATVSSSTTTSTSTLVITTSSICFTSKSGTAITACTSGRKKRLAQFFQEDGFEDEFAPSRVERYLLSLLLIHPQQYIYQRK